MARLEITLTDKEMEQIKKDAKRVKVTPEELGQKLVGRFANRQEWKDVLKIGARIGKRLGIKTDEDVMRVFFNSDNK